VQRAPYEYRADPAVPRFADDRPVIDGKCVLCCSSAQFILQKDRNARFRLLAAQSELGNALYRHFGLDPVNYESYVLLQDGKAYLRSEASIRILNGLGPPWSLLAKFTRLVPLSIRDALYDVMLRTQNLKQLRSDASRAQVRRSRFRDSPIRHPIAGPSRAARAAIVASFRKFLIPPTPAINPDQYLKYISSCHGLFETAEKGAANTSCCGWHHSSRQITSVSSLAGSSSQSPYISQLHPPTRRPFFAIHSCTA
jgi:predicted DCC family thiol-disulfide oxidoreductase YuxK